MDKGQSLLTVEEVHTYYGNIHALKGASLKVSQGEIVTLIGSNGAGKSTMLNTISGLTRLKGGGILFEGDRIDHLLGNALVLAGPRYRPLRPRWLVKGARVQVVHDHVVITGHAGDTVSLLAVGGPATGVATTGLRWQLRGEDRPAGSSRGLSNEMTGAQAEISLETGTLLAVHVEGLP